MKRLTPVAAAYLPWPQAVGDSGSVRLRHRLEVAGRGSTNLDPAVADAVARSPDASRKSAWRSPAPTTRLRRRAAREFAVQHVTEDVMVQWIPDVTPDGRADRNADPEHGDLAEPRYGCSGRIARSAPTSPTTPATWVAA
jgi:hypothetical protein